MRDYTAPELTYLQNRTGFDNHILLWVEPRDYTTGDSVPMGFWTGDQDASFTIDGVPRTYQAGGAITNVDPIMMQTGLVVRSQRITLSPLHAGVAAMVRGNDAWRAPAQMHRAMFDPITGALVAAPRRIWKGFVHAAPIKTPPIGGEGSCEVSLTSAADKLTKGLTATRSDASQSQRGGDRFYRYKDVAAKYSWGA